MEIPINNVNNKQINQSSIPKFIHGWKEAAGIGVVGSAPSMYYFSQIDPTVMDALDFAFAEDLSNFNTLVDHIDDKYFDVLNTSGAEGWMTRFEGYVMEMHSVDVLENMGYEVELPETANQEGWDVLLDGEPWQIKGGQSPEVIAEHFEKYPDIPVITNADLGAHYEGYDNVMVLDDVSAETIQEIAGESLNAVNQLDSTMGAGIPVVSLIISTYREVKLHNQNKTDLGASVKNVGLDVAGVGVGGFAGALIGAFIGGFGGSFGFMVGGLIGGIVGAVVGKSGSNAVKEIAMKEAFHDYECKVNKAQYLLAREQEKAQSTLKEMVAGVNQDLNQANEKLQEVYKQKFEHQKIHVVEKQRLFLEEVPTVLRSIKQELYEIERKLDEEYERPSFLKRMICPSYEDVAYRKTKLWFKERYRILDRALTKFSEEKWKQDMQGTYAEAIEFFKYYEVNSQNLEKILESTIQEAEKADSNRDKMKKDFYLHVLQAEETIRQKAKQSFETLAEKAVIEKQRISKAYDNYMYERGKLGR
ncbi:hypothetical protein [Marinococcus luteus]|uniref:hypothetical protein n=1 Tax=Marinococcus luteus TaxID=1122204 RepID=UPI002ACE2389|nr:hypothetical protein [Marinococcus luteus]